jgi:TM2 domain-containing membrane protein YozV
MSQPSYGQDPRYELPPGSGYPPQPPPYPVSGAGQYGYPTPGTPVPYGYPVSGPPLPTSSVPAGYTVPAPMSPNYGYDPVTGVPYSDKSKVTAGLLQLLLALFAGVGGVGRLYAGNTALGATQLACSALAWASFCCGFAFIFPFFISFGLWIWFDIDGIVMLAGRPVDGSGRPLRP